MDTDHEAEESSENGGHRPCWVPCVWVEVTDGKAQPETVRVEVGYGNNLTVRVEVSYGNNLTVRVEVSYGNNLTVRADVSDGNNLKQSGSKSVMEIT